MRMILFVLFFSIGAAALGGSVLYDDLLRYYDNRKLLREAEQSLKRLESLNSDYDGLLRQLEEDPNLVKRIAPIAVGANHEDPNAIYPRATASQLAAARKALTEQSDQGPAEPDIPGWLMRCGEPRRRLILFIAGACLIVVSFLCFGSAQRAGEQQQ